MADALEMERERARIAQSEPAEAAPRVNGTPATAGDLPLEVRADPPAPVQATGEPEAEDGGGPGTVEALARLAPGTLITEAGLAGIFGKCTASIRAAVDRGELPRPVRLMGKPTWTAGSIIRWHEDRLAAEAKKFARLRSSA